MARLRDSWVPPVLALFGPAAAVIAILHFSNAPDRVWLATLVGLSGIALFAGGRDGEDPAGRRDGP